MRNHFSKHGAKYIYFSLLMIVVGYAGVILFKTRPISVYSMEKAGLFGDSFGVITCFFTALGFIGLLINLKEQSSYNKKQVFESNFFQMLNHLNEITKDINVSIYAPLLMREVQTVGRGSFKAMNDALKSKYKFKAIYFSDDDSQRKTLTSLYERFWDEYGGNLGHYFRWLYHLMKFVDMSDSKDKDFYIKLICAQLSNQELVLLFYNSSFVRGENFAPLLIKYNIMSNTEPEDLGNESHKTLIPGVKFWKDL